MGQRDVKSKDSVVTGVAAVFGLTTCLVCISFVAIRLFS